VSKSSFQKYFKSKPIKSAKTSQIEPRTIDTEEIVTNMVILPNKCRQMFKTTLFVYSISCTLHISISRSVNKKKSISRVTCIFNKYPNKQVF
jgi:hypothetical protein